MQDHVFQINNLTGINSGEAEEHERQGSIKAAQTDVVFPCPPRGCWDTLQNKLRREGYTVQDQTHINACRMDGKI